MVLTQNAQKTMKADFKTINLEYVKTVNVLSHLR